MVELKKICTSLANELGISFKLRSKDISADEVLSEKGLLPAIAKRAEQLSLLCFNKPLGVEFEESDGAMLGVILKPGKKLPLTSIICISDVLIELTRGIRNAPINVDELLYD